jgi:peptidoglycan-associated lipoprotein
MGVVLMSVGVVMIGTGCAAKRVASTSGDQSATMKGKDDAGGAVESMKEEPVDSPLSTGGSPAKEPRGTLVSPSTPGSGSIPNSAVAPGTRGEASGVPEMTGLGDIYFDFDRYNIRTDAQPVLEGDARWLRNEQGKSLLIEGHCDERGTLAYNLVLCEKRAKSAKRYLEDLGISGSRIQTTSYGEVRPFCKDHNEGCWSKNRRAHFVIQ